MTRSRQILGTLLVGAGTCLLAGPAISNLRAADASQTQDQAPNRREFDVTASNYRFSPDHIEVGQDDLVKLTVRSADVAYSLTIDDYRVSKRVPAGGTVTFEFRADRPGDFRFYSNLTSDPRHKTMDGRLVVRPAKAR
jgi:heme/copper-type cytochrome/quinol oxidase subunit 2